MSNRSPTDTPSYFHQPSKARWLIVIMFCVVIILEYSTPPPYVFGYLYIGAVLLADSRLSRVNRIQVTAIAVSLTLLNLVIPGVEPLNLATVANRLIAVMALIVTSWLSNRNRQFEQAIAQQRLKLQTQEYLNHVREDFASTLTHDLRTPLLGAIETLTAFQQEKFGAVTAAQRRVLEIMTRSHQASLQLVETLLDVYRNDTEGLHLQRKPVDLRTLADEAIAMLTELAAARRVHLRFRCGDSDFRQSFWVNGDALQLRRVFVNLLENGINHAVRGGKVEIVITNTDIHHLVKVIDNGQGITSDELPLLFERFYQGHGDRQARGSGLGLYLTRQIIEAHDGKIWAENSSSQGAVLVFCLPTLVSAASASPLT
ncbi:MAG: HAMP domain-containing histidine kinase [Leptolyngbyaceae cyanobacterium SL_5_9]|nr:HAMP domain-containing histidine kinase [Leptolyngbyaceae cyanobacterium SL_5_9]NJO74013.1 HAMP domain-containing histidine kinase [Leptolyngbyaceae cyanobacterium RM1_406_9]